MHARGRWWIVVAVLSVGAAADAAPGGKVRIARVQKGHQSDVIHMYWASPATQTDVSVSLYSTEIRPGDEFELIDQNGYLGRMKAAHVEKQPVPNCGGAFWAVATGVPERRVDISSSLMVAIPPQRMDLGRARVMTPDQFTDGPKLDTNQNQYVDLGIDLDGDKRVDYVRVGYECPPGGAGGGGGAVSYAYCSEVRGRRGNEWVVIERIVMPQCY